MITTQQLRSLKEQPADARPDCVATLVAEIERLQTEVSSMRRQIETLEHASDALRYGPAHSRVPPTPVRPGIH